MTLKDQKVAIYHYTYAPNWERYLDEDFDETPGIKDRGLVPTRPPVAYRLCPDLPEEAREPVIFGLLEPRPLEWINNKDFPHIWTRLLSKAVNMHPELLTDEEELVLIRASVDPNNAYVIDWKYVAEYQRKNDFSDKVMKGIGKAYWNSRVRLVDYRGGHSLPEVITSKHIPLTDLELLERKRWVDFI